MDKISKEASALTDCMLHQQQNDELQQKLIDLKKIFTKRKNFIRLIFQLRQIFAEQDQYLRLQQLQEFANTEGFGSFSQALMIMQDAYGQSLLQKAFEIQDFGFAKHLLDHGAIPSSADIASFELALDSIAASDYGFTEAHKQRVNKLPPGKAIHDVKYFGLTLGIIMTSHDGTFSQLGKRGPTYSIMSKAVQEYANTRANPNFHDIMDAFEFAEKRNTSQYNPLASEELAKRIQEDKKITTIPVSCQGHTMGLSVVPKANGSNSGYLVFTNRGIGAKGDYGTAIYKIDDLSKITPSFITTMMQGNVNGIPHDEIKRQILAVTNGKGPITTISQKKQKRKNCTIANPRSNIEGILLCQEAIKYGKPLPALTADEIDTMKIQTKAQYKEFTHHMRASKIEELLVMLAEHPENPDYKVLAQKYLEQHTNTDNNPKLEALRQKVETGLNHVQSQELSLQKSPNTLLKSLTKEKAKLLSSCANQANENPSQPAILNRFIQL